MNDCDLYWLAGILEGEGSFIHSVPGRPAKIIISMQTTDEDVIQRVASLLDSTYYASSDERQRKHPNWKKLYGTSISGLKAQHMMQKLRPLMGIRRGKKIDECLEIFKNKAKPGRYLTEEIVKSIIGDNKNKAMTQGEIARKYGLRRETVNKMCCGKSIKWKYLVS